MCIYRFPLPLAIIPPQSSYNFALIFVATVEHVVILSIFVIFDILIALLLLLHIEIECIPPEIRCTFVQVTKRLPFLKY
jgi:hypothetical protein